MKRMQLTNLVEECLLQILTLHTYLWQGNEIDMEEEAGGDGETEIYFSLLKDNYTVNKTKAQTVFST